MIIEYKRKHEKTQGYPFIFFSGNYLQYEGYADYGLGGEEGQAAAAPLAHAVALRLDYVGNSRDHVRIALVTPLGGIALDRFVNVLEHVFAEKNLGLAGPAAESLTVDVEFSTSKISRQEPL